jgi:hypothetical protein
MSDFGFLMVGFVIGGIIGTCVTAVLSSPGAPQTKIEANAVTYLHQRYPETPASNIDCRQESWDGHYEWCSYPVVIPGTSVPRQNWAICSPTYGCFTQYF